MATRLSEPVHIGTMQLRNRMVMPPMVTQYGSPEGFVTERTKNYYGARAKGGTALIIIEADEDQPAGDVERLMLLAQLAGVLHDIKRMEPEHAVKGAEEAEIILQEFELEDRERRAIVQAIRNHEAFKPAQPLEEPSLQVLSDALYDADKFRWGPDNFTETVWMMVAPMNVPLDSLLDYFLPSLDGIERIAGTFRTRTGREYGPDFIVRGLEIGQRIYQELAGDIERDE